MAQVDKSSVHVQILSEEAASSKKAGLELQLLTLNSMRNLLTIKELRKSEFDTKRQARTKSQEISKLIKEMKEILPVLKDIDVTQGMEGYDVPDHEEVEEPPVPVKKESPAAKKKVVKEKMPPKIKKDRKAMLDEELQEIKNKLDSMQ